MQASVDGYVQSDPSDVDWQLWDWNVPSPWDAQLIRDFNQSLTDTDVVLLSRQMVEDGFIDHWAEIGASQTENPGFDFARRIDEIEKVVVTRSPLDRSWPRTRIVHTSLEHAVGELKAQTGGDIIAYGGVRFARALASAHLVDEYRFYVNPAAAGGGETILLAGRKLDLISAQPYECGVVVLSYRDQRGTGQ
jgi:dihydrofolate reductase